MFLTRTFRTVRSVQQRATVVVRGYPTSTTSSGPSKVTNTSDSKSNSKYNSNSNSNSTPGSIFTPAGPIWHLPSANPTPTNPAPVPRHASARGDLSLLPPHIPQIPIGGHSHDESSSRRRRVLILCTGGTLTMAPDATGALAPVPGALRERIEMDLASVELGCARMPEVVLHEYDPIVDSSDLGPADWAAVAGDVRDNYNYFDGFVVVTGTDTMAYAATALSFLLENLGKPVVFTGSQVPLSEPHNDARRNLIMSLIFASLDTIPEVTIFFDDRLLRACRSTKISTNRLAAFSSPNLPPLATVGTAVDTAHHLLLPQPRGALRAHARMDTRTLTLRMVPGFDDGIIKDAIEAARGRGLKGLVLQLYGTGNLPRRKRELISILKDATEDGVVVVAATQCLKGSVMMGHYATGQALVEAGVVSGADMTIEAISCKLGYLLGRGDLSYDEVVALMGVSLRGEMTSAEDLPPPPFAGVFGGKGRR